MPKVRHYGRYVGEFCIFQFGSGPEQLVRVMHLDSFDNNCCYVDFVNEPKAKGEKYVCEWLQPWLSPLKPKEQS